MSSNYNNITISFDNEWMLSNISEFEIGKMPSDLAFDVVKKLFGEAITHSDIIPKTCLVTIDASDEKVKILLDIEVLSKAISEGCSFPIDSFVISIEACDEPIIAKKCATEIIKDAKEANDNECNYDSTSVLEQIDGLVGAAEFKALAHEIADIAPAIKKNNLRKAFNYQNYLFSVNEGDGFDTYMKLLSDVIRQNDLFYFRPKKSIVNFEFNTAKTDFNEMISLAIEDIACMEKQLVCIDITPVLNNIKSSAFSKFLTKLEEVENDNIFVFRVPFLEKSALEVIATELNDVLYVRPVSIAPFDISELKACAEKFLTSFEFTMTNDAWPIFEKRIREEKHIGRFYGIKTVNKVVHEMLYLKARASIGNPDCENVICATDIKGLVQDFGKLDEKSGREELDNLIGITQIKNKIEEIVNQMKATSKLKKKDKPCMHMCFKGNPGTGKTTVARIIGKILCEEGVLRNGNFYEHLGRDFCGKYVGSTAPKTMEICRDAYGSVLFVDEAYSLFTKSTAESNDFGKEALATLVAEMENHRDDMVVILAGYPEDMDTMLAGNSGLKSRIPYTLEFPNFTREDLYNIFLQMCGSMFTYEKELEKAAKDYFDKLSDAVLESHDFANGRFVRNLYERTWSKASTRKQLAGEDGDKTLTLTADDFNLASSEEEFAGLQEKKKQSSRLGFY